MSAEQVLGKHHLSYWSLLHFVVQWLHFIWQQIFFMLPLIYTINQMEISAFYWLIPIAGIFLIGTASALAVKFFSYQISEDEITVNQGVVSKRELHLKFNRIQNINLLQPLYFRPLGLVSLRLDGAGSAEDEVILPALNSQQAAAIKAYIETRLDVNAAPTPEPLDATADTYTTRQPIDLLLHGLTHPNFFIIAVLGILLSAIDGSTDGDTIENTARSIFTWLGDAIPSLGAWLDQQHGVLFFALAAIPLIFIWLVFSALGTLLINFNYRLENQPKHLRFSRGLTTRKETAAKKSRVQTLQISQNIAERLVSRCTMVFDQFSSQKAGKSDGAAPLNSDRVFIPSIRTQASSDSEVRKYGAWVMPILAQYNPFDLVYTPAKSLSLWLPLIVINLATLIVFVVAILIAPEAGSLSLKLWLAISLLSSLAVFLRHRRAGLCQIENVIIVRSGFLGVRYRVFECHKCQKLVKYQSRTMRKHGVAKIMVHLASSIITLPSQDNARANQLLDQFLFQISAEDRSWM